MFCDQVEIKFMAGRGGNGCKSFRREKYIPYGGPDGGDGGKGGDIILVADVNINTLSEFNARKVFRGYEGTHGTSQKASGAQGDDMILKVPCGTMIFSPDRKQLITDLKNEGDRFTAAKGGQGGKGNAHLASSMRQAPSFAELGEPGEVCCYLMEMRIVADVGIIGFPSVGKSTIISRISDARPKIADYPFTTLIPNLGVVKMKKIYRDNEDSFVVADIPGLIEGASEGKGLGHDFLRHISRTAILLHVLDAYAEDPRDFYKKLNKELEKYDKELLKKETLICINKADLIDEKRILEIKKMFPKKKLFLISAVTGAGIEELIKILYEKVKALRLKKSEEIPQQDEDFKTFRPHLEQDPKVFSVLAHRQKKGQKPVFEVKCRRLEQIVTMTDFSNAEAIARVYDVLEKMFISKKLLKMGAKRGDIVRILDRELEFLA